MNNNKIIFVGLIIGIVASFSITTFAGIWAQAYQNSNIKITYNGNIQEFKDEKTGEIEVPITYNNRTYLPLRSIANLVGYNVKYDSENKVAVLEHPEYEESEYQYKLARFFQYVDNLQMTLHEKYLDIKVNHAVNKRNRTDEQIWYEVATGLDAGDNGSMMGEDFEARGSLGKSFQRINPAHIMKDYKFKLPIIKGTDLGWYITKDGRVFNIVGEVNNGKTYYSGSVYSNTIYDNNIFDTEYSNESLAIKIADTIINGEVEVK